MHLGAREIHRIARGVEAQVDAGIEVLEAADARQQPALQEGRQQGDLQRPLGAVLFQVLHRGFELVQPAAHAGQQLLAFGGELDTPPGALEQLHLQVVLEGFDLLAHGRRRHVQGFGGIRKRQPRRHGFENSKRIERQAGIGGAHVSFPNERFKKRVCSWRDCSAHCTHRPLCPQEIHK